MATFQKVNGYVEHLAHGVHNLGSDQLKVAFSNVAPSAESSDPSVNTADCILANVTEVSYTNCGSRDLTTVSSQQTGGTYKLTLEDLNVAASGGPVGPFRYVYLFNDTPTSPADPLIGYWDRGNSITLQDGESIDIDVSEANGVLQNT